MTGLKRPGAVLLAAVLAMMACGDDSNGPEPDIDVEVTFRLHVDGAVLQLNTSAPTYANSSGTKYGINEIRFIVSDVRLHSDDGKSVLLDDVHYFDVDDVSTQKIHKSGLPHANYTHVTFRFGLDAAKNVRDRYPWIPAVMVWPEGMGAELGYHYMQMEGNYELTPGGATGGYETHTGAHHLNGEPAAEHYDFPVSASFTPTHIHEGGHGEIEIGFDLNGWYTDHAPTDGVDSEYDFTTLPDQMILGNSDAQTRLMINGPGCFTATMTAEGGHDD
jgi:hypothetical protein